MSEIDIPVIFFGYPEQVSFAQLIPLMVTVLHPEGVVQLRLDCLGSARLQHDHCLDCVCVESFQAIDPRSGSAQIACPSDLVALMACRP